MKQTFTYFKKAAYILPLLFLIIFVFSSCSKDSLVNNSNNGNGNTGGSTKSPAGTITLVNNAPTAISVNINGAAYGVIPSHGSSTLSGKPGDPVDITGVTLAKDFYGNPVGQPVVLQYSTVYPEDQTSIQQELNVPGDYFFLNVVNLTDGPADQVIVNDPSSGDVNTDVTILNNYKGNAAGYYQTIDFIANIKVVRSKGNAYEWDFDNIKIAGNNNQTISLTCY
jgi:hypothetical protein